MKRFTFWAALGASLLATGAAQADVEVTVDPDFPCEGFCASYNEPAEPFRIYGETYYVGTTRLAAILIDTGDGLILLDGGFPGAAPVIADNIRALGFEVQNIKLIGNSHTHIDHVGVIDALQKATGATVLASPAAADAMEAGHAMPNDPQYRDTDGHDFPPVSNIRRLEDEEIVTLGNTNLMTVFTPGHTPGGTSWTWRECEADACRMIVYADSLNPVSGDAFRYSDDEAYLDGFRNSILKIAALPCDILVAPHPEFSGLWEQKAAAEPGVNPFVDRQACNRYAVTAAENLGRRLAAEDAAADAETEQ